jgi:uncharacterized protein (DUF58 family)
MRRLTAGGSSVTPTLRGWLTLITGALFPGLGRFLGIEELYEIGVALVVLVIASMTAVHRRKRLVRVERRVKPERGAIAGRTVTVDMDIINLDHRPTTSFELEEKLDGSLGSIRRLRSPGLGKNAKSQVSYSITPMVRGRVIVGPARLRTIDPFGFARAIHGGAEAGELFVYPPIEKLTTSMPEGGTVAVGAESPATSPSRGGDEFYAIREFRSGDDMRKIHWKSTARRGEPMIRQEERRSDPMTTVVLDPAPGRAFESRVSAAATLIDDVSIRRHSYRLITLPASDVLPQFGQSHAHYHTAMEELAVTKHHHKRAIVEVLGSLKAEATGNVILITSSLEAPWVASWPYAEDDGWGVVVVIGELPAADLLRAFEASHIAVVHSPDGRIEPAWERRFGAVGQKAAAQ